MTFIIPKDKAIRDRKIVDKKKGIIARRLIFKMIPYQGENT